MAKKKIGQDSNILDINAAIQGTVTFKDPVNLRINGDFNGQLDTKGYLTIGENAHVKANITGEHITVAGKVEGDIMAVGSLTVVSPATLIGNIQTPSLSVSAGATVDGVLAMSKPISSITQDTMSVSQVALYLEIEESVLVEWAQNKKIPAVWNNDQWQFNKPEIEAWIIKEKVSI